jgi:hypothetical protein
MKVDANKDTSTNNSELNSMLMKVKDKMKQRELELETKYITLSRIFNFAPFVLRIRTQSA